MSTYSLIVCHPNLRCCSFQQYILNLWVTSRYSLACHYFSLIGKLDSRFGNISGLFNYLAHLKAFRVCRRKQNPKHHKFTFNPFFFSFSEVGLIRTKCEKGQAHDMFSRIFRIRIPNIYNKNFVLIFLAILRTHFEASLRFRKNQKRLRDFNI